jgi:hypothetical protein
MPRLPSITLQGCPHPSLYLKIVELAVSWLHARYVTARVAQLARSMRVSAWFLVPLLSASFSARLAPSS